MWPTLTLRTLLCFSFSMQLKQFVLPVYQVTLVFKIFCLQLWTPFTCILKATKSGPQLLTLINGLFWTFPHAWVFQKFWKYTWHDFLYDMSCDNGSSVVFNIPMHQCWDRLVGSVTLLLLEKEWKTQNQNQIFFPLLSVPFWTPPPLHNRTHMLVHTHHTHKSGMLFWDRN